MKKAALDVKNCYKIVNSISPSLQYYRQSLIPSLLDLIHPNIKQGFDQFAIFEMNKTHPRSCGLTDENVPIELDMLGMVITNKNPNSDTAYYQVKRVLDYITETVGLKLNYELINDESDPIYVAFEPKRSATVVDSGTGKVLGVIGEYKTSVIKLFKLPIKSAGLEINMKDLFESAAKLGVNYKPLSRFPSTERDLCFKVQKDTAYSKLTDAINKSSEPDGLDLLVTPIDIYQPEMGDTKNITIRIRLTASDHTLTGDETNEVVGRLVSAVTAATGAEVV